MYAKKLIFLIIIFVLGLYLIGCFPASQTEGDENTDKTEEKTEEKTPEVTGVDEADGAKIMSIAASEQDKEMYSPKKDTTFLYWLNNRLARLKGYTKCNVFALNVLYKSGYKTPKENALCRDLVDTTRFTDIMPVVGIKDVSDAKKGDLIIWKHHVIIFEAVTQQVKNDLYVTAWWAGTRQKDNGDNVRNNVIYGKYKLSGHYIVRRPLKK